MRTLRLWLLAFGALLLLAAGCGDDDSSTGDDDTAAADDAASADGDGDGSDTSDAPDDSSADSSDAPDDSSADAPDTSDDGAATPTDGGGGAGTLELGDEAIAFDSARCFLEEQDAAAGGGSILFVGQAFGTNAAGDEVSIDISRYSDESQFAGDDVSVVIGDPFSADAVSLYSSSPTGTVSLDGSVMSATSITFTDDDFNEVPGSFVVNC